MGNLLQLHQVTSEQFPDITGAESLWPARNRPPLWYAVFTLTRHEKRANAQCEQREIESFLPLYRVKRRWKNRCNVDLELPLFPSYFFVRIDPCTRVKVLELPGVVSIVSSGRQPAPVPDNYISFLRGALLARTIEPHPNVEVGDWVSIRTGPLAGVQGVLYRRKNDLRVVVKLEMLTRSVSVEVGAEEIERCDMRSSYS